MPYFQTVPADPRKTNLWDALLGMGSGFIQGAEKSRKGNFEKELLATLLNKGDIGEVINQPQRGGFLNALNPKGTYRGGMEGLSPITQNILADVLQRRMNPNIGRQEGLGLKNLEMRNELLGKQVELFGRPEPPNPEDAEKRIKLYSDQLVKLNKDFLDRKITLNERAALINRWPEDVREKFGYQNLYNPPQRKPEKKDKPKHEIIKYRNAKNQLRMKQVPSTPEEIEAVQDRIYAAGGTLDIKTDIPGYFTSKYRDKEGNVRPILLEKEPTTVNKMVADIIAAGGTFDLSDQTPEERLKFLQAILNSAQGQYYDPTGTTGFYSKEKNPEVAAWAKAELDKLPMFAGQGKSAAPAGESETGMTPDVNGISPEQMEPNLPEQMEPNLPPILVRPDFCDDLTAARKAIEEKDKDPTAVINRLLQNYTDPNDIDVIKKVIGSR